MKKTIILIIVITIIIVGFYLVYWTQKKYQENRLLEHMGQESFPIVGDSVTIKGKIMRTDEHLYVIFPYQPGTKKEAVFTYKKCQNCPLEPAIPGMIISDDKNNFLPLSNYIPDAHEVQLTGRLNEKELGGRLHPFIEINDLKILE